MGGVKLKILLFILLSFYSFAFEFSPMGFDKRLDTGEGYGEFQYTNSTLDVQRYKISILDNGKENNISQYVSVYPKILTVKPKSVGVIKIYVQTPPTLKKGCMVLSLEVREYLFHFYKKERVENLLQQFL